MRSFDPRRVGSLECRAWETYYRRKWGAFLMASVGLVRAAFRMSWPRTLVGAWLVLRANMVWAPLPDNDPDRARALMRRFYQLLRKSETASFDPTRASELEVEWWRVHRARHHDPEVPEEALVQALVDLYSYVYSGPPELMTAAARHRVEAMDLSDTWVRAGCAKDDPLLAAERRALVASYTALHAAVSSRPTTG